MGAFASPDFIHWSPALPKTRSGKIIRRALRKIAESGKDVKMGVSPPTTTSINITACPLNSPPPFAPVCAL